MSGVIVTSLFGENLIVAVQWSSLPYGSGLAGDPRPHQKIGDFACPRLRVASGVEDREVLVVAGDRQLHRAEA